MKLFKCRKKRDKNEKVRTNIQKTDRASQTLPPDHTDIRFLGEHHWSDALITKKYVHAPLNLLQLPPELLHKIISFLPVDETLVSMKETCLCFEQMVEEPVLWNRDHFQLREGVCWDLVNRFLLSSKRLSSIDFTDCTGVTDHLLATVVTEHPAITYVNITGCVLVTDFGLIKLEQGLIALKSLNIARCNMVTCGGVFRVVRQHEKTIKELNFSECYGMSFDPFRMSRIADYCGSLESLSVGWPVHTVGMNPVMDHDIAKFACSCPRLKCLDVSNGRMAETAVEAVASQSLELRSLSLCHSCIRNSGLGRLSKSLRFLRSLDLTDCSYITDRGVQAVGVSLPELGYLNLTRCFNITDVGVSHILSLFLNIRDLILRGCFRITDDGIKWASVKLKNLFYLDLSSTMISNISVDTLVNNCNIGLRLLTEKCPFVYYGHLLQEVENYSEEWPPHEVRYPRHSLLVL